MMMSLLLSPARRGPFGGGGPVRGELAAHKAREEQSAELAEELKFLHSKEKELTKEMRRRRKELKEVRRLATSLNLTMQQAQVIHEISDRAQMTGALAEESEDEEMYISPEVLRTKKVLEEEANTINPHDPFAERPVVTHVPIPERERSQNGPETVSVEAFRTIPGLYMQGKVSDENFHAAIEEQIKQFMVQKLGAALKKKI